MKTKRALIADLPAGVSVRKTKNSAGTEYFRVELRKKFTGRTGRPITKNFEVLSDAKKWIFGDAQSDRIVDPSVVEIQDTVRDNAFSMMPTEWAEAASAIRRCRESNIDLTAVVDAGLLALRPSGGSRTFSEVALLCQEKAISEKKSESHQQHMRIVANRFAWEFGKEAISTITREALEDWLSEEFDEINTRRYYARYLHLFFGEALSRKWVSENPLKHIARASVPLGDVEFLSEQDVRKLLHHARGKSKVLMIGIAIKAFAGLRTSELLSIKWGDVSLTQLHVRAIYAKTRQARPVTVSPSLASFIKNNIGDAAARVVPMSRPHWHHQLSALASSAEITLPHNCLRHGFGTFHYHNHKNENLTASEMGNTPDTVIRWYRAPIVAQAEIDAFWKIHLRSVTRMKG